AGAAIVDPGPALVLSACGERDAPGKVESGVTDDDVSRLTRPIDLVLLDDRIRNLVRVHQTSATNDTDRLALDDEPVIAHRERGRSAERQHLAVIRREGATELPREAGHLDDPCVDGELDALVLQLADVLQLTAPVSIGGNLGHVHERSRHFLLVVRELRGDAVGQDGCIEPELQLGGALGTELRITDRPRTEGRKSAPARRVPRTNRVERTGRAAGETVRGPELDLPPLILPEGFVREDIGEARLRDRKSTRLNSSHVKISY